jgi:hypothetical protein
MIAKLFIFGASIAGLLAKAVALFGDILAKVTGS